MVEEIKLGELEYIVLWKNTKGGEVMVKKTNMAYLIASRRPCDVDSLDGCLTMRSYMSSRFSSFSPSPTLSGKR